MNILNKLTIKHLKQNKKRTVVTIIGIILSTALMVGIGLLFATVRDNAIKSIEKNNGSHHVLIKIPSDKLEIIKSNKTIKTYKYKSSLGYAKVDGIENDYKPYIEIFNASKNYLDNLELIEGRLPKNSNEIVISDSLLKNNSSEEDAQKDKSDDDGEIIFCWECDDRRILIRKAKFKSSIYVNRF